MHHEADKNFINFINFLLVFVSLLFFFLKVQNTFQYVKDNNSTFLSNFLLSALFNPFLPTVPQVEHLILAKIA